MKKFSVSLAAVFMLAGVLAGCGGSTPPQAESSAPIESAVESGVPGLVPEPDAENTADSATFRIAGLKGPTTMGMVELMDRADKGDTANTYEVEMYGTADEIVPLLVTGALDVALVPANLAAVLNQNENLDIQVAAINTLGVLYVVESGESVQSIEDLRGATVYSTGKGTTPEFALNYVLAGNGIDPTTDVNIEFRSEATEIAALLAGGEGAIAVLPQPYVTAVLKQNENVRIALDLTEEWDKVSEDSQLVTGVLIARTAFIEEVGTAAFDAFLADYRQSIEYVQGNVAEAAELVAHYGIVEQAPIAALALPYCNIVYIDGAELQQTLSGYLEVLYEAEPASVGGALPEAGFYYGIG